MEKGKRNGRKDSMRGREKGGRLGKRGYEGGRGEQITWVWETQEKGKVEQKGRRRENWKIQ